MVTHKAHPRGTRALCGLPGMIFSRPGHPVTCGKCLRVLASRTTKTPAVIHRMTVMPNGTLCGAPLKGSKVTHRPDRVSCSKCRRIWRTERSTIEIVSIRIRRSCTPGDVGSAARAAGEASDAP